MAEQQDAVPARENVLKLILLAICDPGSFLPREREERDGETLHESIQRWGARALVIKAKLEAVESGITTVDEEFLAHLVLPSGGTVGDHMLPQLAAVYAGQELPALLPGGGAR